MSSPLPAEPSLGKKATNSRRVLFFAEAATLAHVARPMVLAKTLEDAGYEVRFACHSCYSSLFQDLARPWCPIQSISSEQFLAALAKGSPLYTTDQLRKYVDEDLRVIDEVAPDLIIGDFRLSLSVSARLAKIPYMTITNAYWSPYASPNYIAPELPITRILGPTLATKLFRLVRPLVFALHTQPLNRLRREFGLPSLGLDLRRTYTDADAVLYADLPELIPTFERPTTHHYIGPINWSPNIDLPSWWSKLPEGKPIIYVTLGSSGQSKRLPTLLAALAKLPVTVVVATAGLICLQEVPSNVYVAEYLPGDQAASCAQLVICNGGSPTTMQALSAGVPVIGIASNLDQYLNMAYLEQAGVGKLMRSGQVAPAQLSALVEVMLNDPTLKERVQGVKAQALKKSQRSEFEHLIAAQF